MLHLTFAGTAYDWEFVEADITYGSNDNEVKQAASHLLEVPVQKFENWVVDRTVNEELTLRANAIFG